ncbi:MAG: nitrilase family protein [Prevotella sp.]|nr:nitrilase family protein [Prevotella sp.]
MKVTIFQINVRWAQPDENVKNVQRLLDENAGSDLYVLPEMWATGFATKPHDIAENEDSIALRWMKQAAVKHSCALSGSLLIKADDGTYRNRHYFVTPTDTVFYDKHHLFSYGHEDDYITAGHESVVATWQGHRFLLLTCYDLRFPLWARYGRAGEYDAIIAVANWPESRQQAWRVLTRARAIENQCYLIGCNRVGDDQFCHYRGESLVCDSKGDTLMACEANEEAAKTVELDFAALQHVRDRFRVLDDRD